MILLDTHVAVWLYARGADAVPPALARQMERTDLGIAPIARLELGYLQEIGRLTVGPDTVVGHLITRIGLQVVDVSVARLVDAALPLSWTRDPFDRLLCAHASVVDGRLATKDETILSNFDRALWPTMDDGPDDVEPRRDS